MPVAMEGGFLTTGPPGKPPFRVLLCKLELVQPMQSLGRSTEATWPG